MLEPTKRRPGAAVAVSTRSGRGRLEDRVPHPRLELARLGCLREAGREHERAERKDTG